ncbi:uncharacterized protein LOC129966182 isoform X2 [Argiope bruennichi]|nr:uncharacterized protein LOC129966182 isoform X2 [Argiope bruennichi]XP_055936564.1 uncharacterized protein LOC129966182 isoform X2 [Argiope bruennichi]
MLRPTFILLFGLIPLVYGQLIIGFCPPLSNYVKDLDFEKYSGQWYVIAQSHFHPMQALNCQRVTYTAQRNGMSVTFNTSKKYERHQRYKNGTLKQEGDNKGEMKLRLNEFPTRFDFRVLHVNYSQVAVEYTCLPGAISYTATISILHRQPVALGELNEGLKRLNLTHVIPDSLKRSIRLVNQTHCED